MRKLLISILAVMYMAAATGASINIHYCMDKMIGAEWGNSSGDDCGKCGMEKSSSKDNCCKEEQKLVKIDLDQKTTDASIQLVKLAATAIDVHHFEISEDNISSIAEEEPTSNAPPKGAPIALYKRNCTYLI